MPRKTIDEKLAAAQERVNKLKNSKRQIDTRAKVVTGGGFIAAMRANVQIRQWYLKNLSVIYPRQQDLDAAMDVIEEMRNLSQADSTTPNPASANVNHSTIPDQNPRPPTNYQIPERGRQL